MQNLTSTEIKFLCDLTVQKLGRILILCGFDTMILKETTKIEEIINLSQVQERIIISRNTKIKTKDSVILKEQNPYSQFKRLIEKLNIKLEINKFFTRCSFCNTKTEKIDKKNNNR